MKLTGVAVALTALVGAAILAGCGGTAAVPGDRIPGTTLTIYSSAPLQSGSGASAQAVVRGAELALARVHARIGKYRIVFKSLDDSSAQRGGWDPGQTSVNARIAIQDPTTIGYLGEYNSGASAVSIPVLNRFEIPQISAVSTAVGVTSSGAGAAPGEPQKYYPTGIRTFARVVPNDVVQAGAQVRLQQALGCRKTYVVDDGEFDGEDMADSFQLVARSAGLDVLGVQAFQRGASDYGPFAASVAQSGADCVLVSALTESGAAQVTRQIATAMPRAKIFGSAGVAESRFADPAKGGIPVSLDPRVLVTVATLGGGDETAAARLFDTAYAQRYGPPELSAIYGYEAMSLLLSAISRASDHGSRAVWRSKVLDEIFDTRARQSVLGTYSIDQDGDTTVRRYGVYKIVAGRLEYWKAIEG